MVGNSNYSLGWLQQLGYTQFLATNFANPIRFQFSVVNPVENAVSGGSDQLQSSTTFHGVGYLEGNAVSGSSDQLAPSLVFRSVGYMAGNAVSCGSGQIDYGFLYPPEYDRYFKVDFAPAIQQRMTIMTTVRPIQVIGGAAEVAGDVVEDNNGSSSSLHDYREHIPYPF
ncbi:hypothetical protein LWI29_022480 [Acer saccharum]|uniref:Uncharacterized protein n=1 Tax=Acer saccharum TaxID=4024 RepID=A0AA39RZU1_ACESA|nr:hypothetical protein LWI29_022480 [Acer saccharum]